MIKVILASGSPRRKELLAQIIKEFEIDIALKEEKCPFYIPLKKVPLYLSNQKAKEVYLKHKDALVIGADTVVICQNQLLGKPKNKQDAKRMIQLLSNKTHIVITGVTILSKRYKKSFSCTTKVTFKDLSEEEINQYCELKTIYDKAGAYAIQGEAKEFIECIDGEYNNVVGLPTKKLQAILDTILK